MRKAIDIIKSLALAFLFTFGLSYIYAAWAPPTEAPPGANAPAPINTGDDLQIKTGPLGVDNLAVYLNLQSFGTLQAAEICFPGGDCKVAWDTSAPIDTGDITGKDILDVAFANYVDLNNNGGSTCVIGRNKGDNDPLNNEVLCSGYNTSGQLGLGNTVNTNVFKEVGASSFGARKISGGAASFCVIRDVVNATGGVDKGQVWCWGSNKYGQLGIPYVSPYNKTVPTRISLVNIPIIDIEVNKAHSGNLTTSVCAIDEDNDVWCWGYNGSGQLGRGYISSGNGTTQPWYYTPTKINLGGRAVALRSGGTASLGYFCAILDDKTAKCWGSNKYGQLGIDSTTTTISSPMYIKKSSTSGDNLQNIIALELSKGTEASHTCAIVGADSTATEGDVYCWGYNKKGAAGDSYFSLSTPIRYPTLVGGVSRATSLALGSEYITGGKSYTCATVMVSTVLGDEQKAKCWGYNYWGNLGVDEVYETDGNPTPRFVWKKVPDIPLVQEESGVLQIAASYGRFDRGSHTCIIQGVTGADNGRVKCTGVNKYYYQAGVEKTNLDQGLWYNVFHGVNMNQPTPPFLAKKIFVGPYWSCAIVSAPTDPPKDNTLQCWGYNRKGGLGVGDTANVPTPRSPM